MTPTAPTVSLLVGRVTSAGTNRAPRYPYQRIAIKETVPAYESLKPVMQILAEARDPSASWARDKLSQMTGRSANWQALRSTPPNESAEKIALNVLKMAYSMRPLEPAVTVSADGGIGIVYKGGSKYAAIECLNTKRLWLLWYDDNGNPQTRGIMNTKKEIRRALEQIMALGITALNANA